MTTPIDTPETDAPAADAHAPAPSPSLAPAPAPTSAPASASDSESSAAAPPVAPTEAAADDAPGAAAEAAPEPSAAPAATPPAGDCGPLLKKTFPALFAGSPKPLKLRIQTDIQERAPGQFSKQALSAFFRRYTGSTSYLIAVSKAKHRFDLDGAPAGELTEEHRKIAQDELARRRGNQESRQALEEQQRRNRATLLHDFERTTLTPANFCALKGIGVDELEGYLATARREAAERPAPPMRPVPASDQPRRGAPSGRPGPPRRR